MFFFYKKLAQVNDEATVIILCSGNANNLDFWHTFIEDYNYKSLVHLQYYYNVWKQIR